MLQDLEVLILMLCVIAGAAVAANRLKVPPAIVLVITGLILAVLPGLPAVDLAPDLDPAARAAADHLFLGGRDELVRLPLQPEADIAACGRLCPVHDDFGGRRHSLDAGILLAGGFVLGAIVSPPDAVAPLAIARRLDAPRRLIIILEGEGLANDATALVLYRFAVAAVSVGSFSFSHAVGTFACIVVGEVLWGLAVGWVMLRLRRWVRDPRIEIILSVLTPFVAYWPPATSGRLGRARDHLHGSVHQLERASLDQCRDAPAGDFLLGLPDLSSSKAMVFLLTGLQARTLIARIAGHSWRELVLSAAMTSLVVIVTRFVWMYPATYIPRWIPSIRRKDPAPPWQWPFALAFTGVRGLVSLAAALAIPLTIENGNPFPYRDLVLFLTFIVILVTLIGQGLALPAVIRALGLANHGRRERRPATAREDSRRRQRAIEASMRRLDEACRRAAASTRTCERRFALICRDGCARCSIAATATPTRRAKPPDRRHGAQAARRGARCRQRSLSGRELKAEARRHIERELDLREARIQSLLAED